MSSSSSESQTSSHSSSEIEQVEEKKEIKETPKENPTEETGDTIPEEEMTEEEKERKREERVLQEIEDWMSKLQKIDKRKDKLSRITGRRNSLDKLSPFLVAETEEDAVQKGNLILQSDRLKQKTGERPDYKELQNKEKRMSKKNGPRKNKNKIGGLFGRRHSFDEISDLLNAADRDEALQNAMKLRRMEKLKKMAGI